MHFPKHLKNGGNGKPQCCKVWHQSYVCGSSMHEYKVSKSLLYNVLAEDLARFKSCPPWFSGFPFLSVY